MPNKKSPVWAIFYFGIIVSIMFSGFTDCGKNGIININYINGVPLCVRQKGGFVGFASAGE